MIGIIIMQSSKLFKASRPLAPQAFNHMARPDQMRSASSTFGISKTTEQVKAGATPRPILKRRAIEIRALRRLSTTNLLRTYFIMAMSSSPRLLDSAVWIIQRMLASKSVVFDPDRNPILHYLFRTTFYAQFCAGDNEAQVKKTISELQAVGYRGVILAYARELLDGHESSSGSAESNLESIKAWREGLLKTVEMANPGDFVAFKWSGMGEEALARLKQNLAPSQAMLDAMQSLCEAAAAKSVKLMPDAEPQYAQVSVDRWTLDLARTYNRLRPGQAILYNTYQMYLKSAPETLSKHLAEALEKGFALGIKLVRGAYLDSEPRKLIHDTKTNTDESYDGVAEALLNKRYGSWLKAHNQADLAFPAINLNLATHNLVSVEKVRQLRNSQSELTRSLTPLSYAQLHGMADEVSCSLLQAQHEAEGTNNEPPQTYKYTSWGTTKECLTYLLRRAAENRDAINRTRVTRIAMSQEIRQRTMDIFRAR